MIKLRENGNALLIILLITPLISCAVLFLQKIKLGSFQREQVRQRIGDDYIEERIPPIRTATKLASNGSTSSSPFLLFDGTQSWSSFLVRTEPASPLNFPHPSWRRLAAIPPGSCNNFANATPARFTQAPKTCTAFGTIKNGAIFAANIQSNITLELAPDTDKLVIAVAGEFTAPLQITLSNKANIELIGFGAINIPSLNVTPRADSSITIHSAASTIQINSTTGTTFCNPIITTNTKLRLEAFGGVSISGANQGAQLVGCVESKQPRFWPKSQILAVNWP